MYYRVQKENKTETTRSQNLNDAFSAISIWTEPCNKDKTVRNWLFE